MYSTWIREVLSLRFPDKATVERIRAEYPSGTQIKLIEMSDPQAPPPGTIGEVIAVDDAGQLVMKWQNGSHLSVIIGVDTVARV